MLKDYVFPSTVQEAIDALEQGKGHARIIAGGTDLTLDMGKLDPRPDYLVDLKNISELKRIEDDGDFVYIGGNVTFSECLSSPLIAEQMLALAMAIGNIGAVQVRNMGTVSGNIVSAQPAADAAVALCAYGALCVVEGCEGTREIPVIDTYAGVGSSKIDPTREVVTGIKVPKKPSNSGNAYVVMDQRKALALPMVCTAVELTVVDGMVADAVIVAAPLAPGPTRVKAAEEFLIGKPAAVEQYEKAGEIATESVSFRSSLVRGSSAYRHVVLPVLIRRALLIAESDIR